MTRGCHQTGTGISTVGPGFAGFEGRPGPSLPHDPAEHGQDVLDIIDVVSSDVDLSKLIDQAQELPGFRVGDAAVDRRGRPAGVLVEDPRPINCAMHCQTPLSTSFFFASTMIMRRAQGRHGSGVGQDEVTFSDKSPGRIDV